MPCEVGYSPGATQESVFIEQNADCICKSLAEAVECYWDGNTCTCLPAAGVCFLLLAIPLPSQRAADFLHPLHDQILFPTTLGHARAP